jgi:hypothetical protein
LRLQAGMLEVDWKAAGLAESSPIRIALHAGPVFCGFDPIMGRDNYFGASVTRAARIEPVTPPASSTRERGVRGDARGDGRTRLPARIRRSAPAGEAYGELRIYRLDRR